MNARIRLALVVTAVLALAAAAGVTVFARSGDGAGTAGHGFAGGIRPAIPPADFTLRDQDGEAATLREYRGQVVVLTFLYTTCRDTCPLTATQIRGALDDLEDPPPSLAVSVDPANDTRERAKRFLFRRGLSGDRMRFLLGTRDQLRPLWRAYGIRPQGEAFDHSAYVLLIDKRGRQRIGFPVEQLTPEGLAHDIRRLQAEA